MHFGGGLARFYEDVTEGLKKRYRDVQPTIVSFDEVTAQRIQGLYSAYFLRNERMTGRVRARHPTARTLPGLARILSTSDIIYAKDDILDLTLLILAGLFKKLPPIVIGFHTPIHYAKTPTIQATMHNVLYSSWYYRFLLSRASGFHVLNTYHETLLAQWFPKKPILKIHNPYKGALFKATKTIPSAVLRLLWIGRLTKDKGFDDLIALIDETNNDHRRRISWTIVGDGAMRTHVANLKKRCNNVTYFSSMKHTALATLYQQHDAFVSTSKWECLPYTVLEAQLSGIPVIAYDIPGNADIIDPKQTGYLVSTPADMKMAIDSFKPTRLNGTTIRQHTLKKFHPETPYQHLYSFFTSFNAKSL